MIYTLRKKFIGICVLSFITVFAVSIIMIYLITSLQTNQTLDRHTDMISQNDGRFPNFNEPKPDGQRPLPPDGFNKESPFTTRYFTVRYDKTGAFLSADIEQVTGVSKDDANEFAQYVIKNGGTRGWVDEYRYKVYENEIGKSVVFVNGAILKENNRTFLLGTIAVFALCSIVIIVLIILISKKAVKPSAESYEKQKQFITNANHELKTPLTLIRTNLDILESDIGKNEWLNDIREETLLMSELVNRMVSLARMDEDGTKLEMLDFSISDAVADTASAFASTVENSGKRLFLNICEHAFYNGNETSIRQVVSILMDNATKYCDIGGEIKVTLTGDKHPILTVENTYSAVTDVELDKLFDRFYRADKARTYGTGFGIGLSLAKAIVQQHRGSISAYRVENNAIGFKVRL